MEHQFSEVRLARNPKYEPLRGYVKALLDNGNAYVWLTICEGEYGLYGKMPTGQFAGSSYEPAYNITSEETRKAFCKAAVAYFNSANKENKEPPKAKSGSPFDQPKADRDEDGLPF